MTVFFSLVTALIGGVIAAVVTYRLNTGKEHVFFVRKKLEELYLALEHYDKSVSSYFIPYFTLLKNEITYDQLHDLQIKDKGSSEPGKSLDAVVMIVGIYFPNLQALLDRYTTARGKLNEILAQHKRAYKNGDIDGHPWLKPYREGLSELDASADALKAAIVQQAREYAPEDSLWPKELTASAIQERARKLWERVANT